MVQRGWIGMGFLRLKVGMGGLVGMCVSSIVSIHFLITIILFHMLVDNKFSPLRLHTNADFTMIIAVKDLICNLILCLSVLV